MFGILYIATILATNVYLETGLAIFNRETGLSMFILKIVYQCLPGNWFSNVYLETDLAVFTWKQVYQCLSGNWFSNVYLETGLAMFTRKLV